jgi:hypothetical protein
VTSLRRGLLVVVLLAFVASVTGHAAVFRTYAQVTIDNTSGGVALPATLIKPAGQQQMNHCQLRLETAEIRFRVDDGAPTTTVGVPMEPLEVVQLDSAVEIGAFRAIRTGAASGVLNGSCWS